MSTKTNEDNSEIRKLEISPVAWQTDARESVPISKAQVTAGNVITSMVLGPLPIYRAAPVYRPMAILISSPAQQPK